MFTAKPARLVEIKSLPRQTTGAPLPTLVSDGERLLLAYIVAEPDPQWDGIPTVVSHATPGLIAVVRFQGPYAHSFGPPNDEALNGHPLSALGLRAYSWFEVLNSPWLGSLERMNAVHPQHRPELFEQYRHFIATFHDTTFECIAEGFDVQLHRGSMRSAVELMTQTLAGGPA